MSETIPATGPVDRAPPTGAPASDVDPFSLSLSSHADRGGDRPKDGGGGALSASQMS
jgi:hypothetical protein